MENITNGLCSLSDEQAKNKYFQAQMKRVYLALFKEPKTMLMASKETGVLRANICRYIAEWRKRGCVDITKVDKCSITSFEANYYTTNPQLFEKSKQLKIFDLD